ncbi:hypothetical protein HX13_21705 [Chryseobacterium sp. P1-3]|nr:hypothetical protein HX13_21705 [Chryseobacterium sp. P1-3]
MSSVWDAVGIAIANNISPENQTQALGLAALAIILTKGKAAPGIIRAEAMAANGEIKALSRTEMANIWGAGPLRIDPKNLPKSVTSDFTEILAGEVIQ